jgi:hypothetical protein
LVAQHPLANAVDENHLLRALANANLKHALKMRNLEFEHHAGTETSFRVDDGVQVQIDLLHRSA